MTEINRREWMVQTGALAAAGAAFGQQIPAKGWFDRPMRWAQLAFVEDDPGRYDPAFWLDYFKRIHADAACLSAGGCVAFYPTKVPLHYRSKFLAQRRRVRRDARRLPQARHERDRARGSARRASGRLRRSSGLDRRGSQRQASPPLGDAGVVGDLRAGSLQLRVHDRRDPRDHDALQGGRHLREPLERVGHVFLRALPAEFQGVQRLGSAANHGGERARARSTPRGSGNASWRCIPFGTREIKKRNPEAAYFPNGYDQIRDSVSVPILFADRQARSGYTMPWAERQNRKGVPRNFRHEAHRGHLQRRIGGAVPLEGLRPESQ